MKRVGTGPLSRRYGRIGLVALAVASLSVPLATTAQAAPSSAPRARPATVNAPGGFEPDTLLPPGTSLPAAAARPPAATGTPKTYKVYATREGLVGHTTANGHVIVANDHFVSLPSTLSLSAKGENYYSVRVCLTSGSRCAYEPVWDVGPWNTRDNYWTVRRTSWTKLPIGEPEAEAAYQSGYNGGRDQFGRKVVNPAGIDLADGTIRQGLGLTSSGWVDVTYLWTGGGVRGTISTDGGTVNVRSGDSTAHAIVGMAGPNAQIPIQCQLRSQKITRSGTSYYWYRLAPGNYISAAYVNLSPGTKISTC
jgi:hypothetical protein